MSRLQTIYERSIEKTINDWGRNISVIYGDTAECNSCSWDEINKEATNISCATCDGLYYYQTESTLNIKGVLKTFIGDMKFRDYALHKFGYVPEEAGRLTCWLSDVLVNDCSATGVSYLDNGKNIRVEVDGNKYTVLSTFKTGIEHLKVIVSTLKVIK